MNEKEPEDEEPFVIPRFKAFDSPFPEIEGLEGIPYFSHFGLLAILNEKKEVVPVRSLREWGEWMEAGLPGGGNNRRVAETSLNGWWVSTVFLGMNHDHTGQGPGLWFETMAFPEGEEPIVPELAGKLREYLKEMQFRYATYAEAEKGHEAIVEMIRCGLF